MKDQIFTTVELSTGEKVVIVEPKGKHLFSAIEKSTDNDALLFKFLTLELSCINGKNITEDQLNEMSLNDVNSLVDAVGIAINNENFNSFFKNDN